MIDEGWSSLAVTPSPEHGVALITTVAVLIAGALHATWNALVKASADRYAGMVVLGAGQTLGGVALVWWAPAPAPASWPWLGASVLTHTLYLVLLSWAYRVGDFNQAYPLARGVGPLVVAGVAAVGLGERLSRTQLVGVAAVSAALVFLAFANQPGVAKPAMGRTTAAKSSRWKRPRPAAAATLTGLSIATYTLLDGVGVRLSQSPLGYGSWMFIGLGPCAWACAYAVRRAALRPAVVAQWRTGVLGGLVSVTAYSIVLWAQTTGALAAVAALRETGIITGAVIGVLAFKERFGAARIAAAVVIAAGVVLINLQ